MQNLKPRSPHTLFVSLIGIALLATLALASIPQDHATANANAPQVHAHYHAAAAAPVATTSVDIQNFAFSPGEISVNVGDTVVWTNKDGPRHNVTFKDNGLPSSTNLSNGGTFSHTFTSAGTFEYFCSLHSGMTGKVVVNGAQSAATATPTVSTTPAATGTPIATSTATPTPAATGTPLPPCLMTTVTFGKENASVQTNATGQGVFVIYPASNQVTYNISFANLSSAETAAHFHGFAPAGSTAPVLINLAAGSPKIGVWQYTDAQENGLLSGQVYANVHSTNYPGGEIRAQLTGFKICQQVNLPALHQK
ncbi:MAG: CHRD domain-containing protein [Anaerolineae bacterium]|nr:CHRD domain-containing protein [Anaerolineae bacterium]